jgi:AcrR family transcriptional regulator
VSTPTRDRILTTTTDLFRRQGYSATGIKQIVEHAGAAFGSIYHFFPGGKEQLGAEVIRTAGSRYGDLIDLVYGADPDAVRATRTFFREAARTMVAEDFADICPIATVALEVASTSEPLREATATVFDQWRDRVARHLIQAGLTRRAARRLAVSLIALIEGSFLLARAGRSTEPLEINAGVAAGLVQAALNRRGTRAVSTPSGNA